MTSTDSVTARPGDDELLVVSDLTTHFHTSQGTVHAVDGVSLRLRAGEALGVVGESGSGKSVLARSIMRLTPSSAITSGSVRFEGRELVGLPRQQARSIWGKDISMVFQNPMTALNPVMRIGRQIEEPLKLHLGYDGKTARIHAIDLLSAVGIPEPARRMRSFPHQLSGGMRQRICIAIAIACSPRLLLADEPTTALDVTIQRQIMDLLSDLRVQRNMAMMLITHDLGVVAGRTDRVMVMYGGRPVEIAPTKTVFAAPRHPYTAALMAAIPRIDAPSHSRLAAIAGRPVTVLNAQPMCRFAQRCPRAQPKCLEEDPPLMVDPSDPNHLHACFFPIGSDEGQAALDLNLVAGHTAAGLEIDQPDRMAV